MKTQEILSIVALSLLGLCFLSGLVKMAMKKESHKKPYEQGCAASVFIAVVLLGISQLLNNTTTREGYSTRHFKFVEIGTSDFDTEIEKASDTDVGLSVEPLKMFLDRLPDKRNCKKVNVAISDQADTMSMYYVDPKDVRKHELPYWIVGSNSLGNPHPFVLKLLQEKNLESLIKTTPVQVITFGMLMEEQGIASIDYLKVDTEGHDPTVLRSMIEYCDRNPEVYPLRIQFETNGLADKRLEEEIIKALEKRGYSVESRGNDTVMTLKE